MFGDIIDNIENKFVISMYILIIINIIVIVILAYNHYNLTSPGKKWTKI
jgi:hypothetical protein